VTGAQGATCNGKVDPEGCDLRKAFCSVISEADRKECPVTCDVCDQEAATTAAPTEAPQGTTTTSVIMDYSDKYIMFNDDQNCEQHGMDWIWNLADCEEAASDAHLMLTDKDVYNAPADATWAPGSPFGCYFIPGNEYMQMYLNLHSSPGTTRTGRQAVCKIAKRETNKYAMFPDDQDCESHGMEYINTKAECEEAVSDAHLTLEDQDAEPIGADTTYGPFRPFGCYFKPHKNTFMTNRLWFNAHSSPGTTSTGRQAVCRFPPGSWSQTLRAECADCPYGKYQDKTDQYTCKTSRLCGQGQNMRANPTATIDTFCEPCSEFNHQDATIHKRSCKMDPRCKEDEMYVDICPTGYVASAHAIPNWVTSSTDSMATCADACGGDCKAFEYASGLTESNCKTSRSSEISDSKSHVAWQTCFKSETDRCPIGYASYDSYADASLTKPSNFVDHTNIRNNAICGGLCDHDDACSSFLYNAAAKACRLESSKNKRVAFHAGTWYMCKSSNPVGPPSVRNMPGGTCKACPAGQSQPTNSHRIRDCEPNPKGMNVCQQGQFLEPVDGGNTQCTNCAPGFYEPTTGIAFISDVALSSCGSVCDSNDECTSYDYDPINQECTLRGECVAQPACKYQEVPVIYPGAMYAIGMETEFHRLWECESCQALAKLDGEEVPHTTISKCWAQNERKTYAWADGVGCAPTDWVEFLNPIKDVCNLVPVDATYIRVLNPTNGFEIDFTLMGSATWCTVDTQYKWAAEHGIEVDGVKSFLTFVPDLNLPQNAKWSYKTLDVAVQVVDKPHLSMSAADVCLHDITKPTHHTALYAEYDDTTKTCRSLAQCTKVKKESAMVAHTAKERRFVYDNTKNAFYYMSESSERIGDHVTDMVKQYDKGFSWHSTWTEIVDLLIQTPMVVWSTAGVITCGGIRITAAGPDPDKPSWDPTAGECKYPSDIGPMHGVLEILVDQLARSGFDAQYIAPLLAQVDRTKRLSVVYDPPKDRTCAEGFIADGGTLDIQCPAGQIITNVQYAGVDPIGDCTSRAVSGGGLAEPTNSLTPLHLSMFHTFQAALLNAELNNVKLPMNNIHATWQATLRLTTAVMRRPKKAGVQVGCGKKAGGVYFCLQKSNLILGDRDLTVSCPTDMVVEEIKAHWQSTSCNNPQTGDCGDTTVDVCLNQNQCTVTPTKDCAWCKFCPIEGSVFTVNFKCVPGTAAPPAPVAVAPEISGLTVTGACGTNVPNGHYTSIGNTRDGRQYFRHDEVSKYLFYDSNCNGDTKTTGMWLFSKDDKQPSTTRTNDLDNDGTCGQRGYIRWTSNTVPINTNVWSIFCDKAWKTVALTIIADEVPTAPANPAGGNAGGGGIRGAIRGAISRAGGGGGSSGGGSKPCFPGAATVELQNGTHIPMTALRANDVVRVSATEFSKVYMFTHNDPAAQSVFVTLRTASATLRITGNHYIYVNGQLQTARTVRLNDTLSAGPVLAISLEAADGLYNPHTMHGDIVVDGVRTSTYTDSLNPTFAHALLWPVRALAATGLSLAGDDMVTGGGAWGEHADALGWHGPNETG
jgi:hypothetical protein